MTDSKTQGQGTVTFTFEKLKQFKVFYVMAKERGVESFEFEDKVYVVGYAKYLIEYLEGMGNDRSEA